MFSSRKDNGEITIFKNRGVVLIIATLVMILLLFLGIYFISFSLAESKISKNQVYGTQAYYIAESGINRAIWMLKNDDEWSTCFVTTTVDCNCNNWSADFSTGTNDLVPNSTISVSIQNSGCARGRVVATSTIDLGAGRTAQRVVKTTLFKSLASPTEGAAVFSGGTSENINISLSNLNIIGSLFSNNNLVINLFSDVRVSPSGLGEGKVLAVGNYNETLSSVSSTAICAKNICDTTSTCACLGERFEKCEEAACPLNSVSVPLVDFASAATSSFKSRAQDAEDAGRCSISCQKESETPYQCSNNCVFSEAEFDDLLWEVRENGILTLNTTTSPGIVYVEGRIDIKGGRNVIVNGTLAADNTIDIGERYKWTKGPDKDEGFSQITVNRPAATTTSGLLGQSKINFGLFSSFTTTTITGVIYANDEIKIVSVPQSFDLTGGMVGRKVTITSVLNWFNFTIDDEVMRYGLGYEIDGVAIVPDYSPIITVEHWEESY